MGELGTKGLASVSRRSTRAAVVDYNEDDDQPIHKAPKKTKRTRKTDTADLEDELVDIISDFNLCVNELFQLKEYGLLVEWNPRDFSRAVNPQLPEIFDYFVDQNNYALVWDESFTKNLDSFPLRIQKKMLLQREEKLREKFPFMDDVNERSAARELDIIDFLAKPKRPLAALSNNRFKRPKIEILPIPELPPPKTETDLLAEFDLPLDWETMPTIEDDIEVDTNYKLKVVKYSIPPPFVTHPTHIPLWRPKTENDVTRKEEIIDFKPQCVEITSAPGRIWEAPSVEARLEEFMAEKFRCPIIDDNNNVPDYVGSAEEYKSILDQQKRMFSLLRQKIDEERIDFVGDKFETRKMALPNPQKVFLDPFRDFGAVVPKIQGAANNQTFQDHFLAQGMAFSRIHQQMRRLHVQRMKKIVLMIDQHFRKKRGEKERLNREREQNLRKIGRLAIQSVKKRWSQAHRVYRYLQNEKEEKQKQIEGREHLSKMLEHSTQLLEAQLNVNSNATLDSENFSSSGSESGLDSEAEKSDSELTVEQLRQKYADIDSKTAKTNGLSLDALYGTPEKKSTEEAEYTEEQKTLIDSMNNGHNEMLDSDESDSIPEESSSDAESAESAESGDEKEPTDLASLYGLGPSVTPEASENGEMTDDVDEPQTPKLEDEHEETEQTEEVNGLKVRDVPVPSLLRGTLRPYQKQGLNWLASLYNNNTNGILADEMGLGKTIQTISLLAHLACEHQIWGPHLIIVPTSVMLNWEMEFKKFAPGFKVMTYYGSPQERQRKRKGWNKMDAFHVCITSYQLVVHDLPSFKRRRWRYMILDEAHNIKNFKSTRWNALLNFNTENRLLLTGTPLQNNLMELWSLLYFLMPLSKVDQMMPEGFANYEDFQQWFGKPVDKILEKTHTGDIIDENVTSRLDDETKNLVARLHQVLRPYLLRRLKRDVEKQMPGKYEHIVYCRLSKRQRYLYDDFMSRAKTKETLASGNFLSIINCLMQLRKVCNHPDLFEVRPIVTSLAIPKAVVNTFTELNSVVQRLLEDKKPRVNLSVLNMDLTSHDDMNYFVADALKRLQLALEIEKLIEKLDTAIEEGKDAVKVSLTNVLELNKHMKLQQQIALRERYKQALYVNRLRCERAPLYGESALAFMAGAVTQPDFENLVLDLDQRVEAMREVVDKYAVITPSVVTLDMKDQLIPLKTRYRVRSEVLLEEIENPFHQAQVKLSIAFPDKQLLQYDCGKLQKLAALLHDLVPNGHRALIFTQMTKVLDILEQFLNIHGYRYMRLDGATKIEDRQLLTERFNRDPKIPVFILSTRSGGLGINLTGADTVIFYDSDWNPAMDKQCQDRCHRIGQSRDVHIYRFVSEYTIESNILKKANQKRQLDNVVIQEGDFTTDYLGKFSVRDLVNDTSIISDLPDKPIGENVDVNLLAQAEDEADRNAAREAMKEVAVDDQDFSEEKSDGRPKGSNLDDEDYDAGVGHIDEYMLRFIGEGDYVE